MSADGSAPQPSPQRQASRPPPPGRRAGPLDPRAVPCSSLGIKEVHAMRSMGPPSGAELVSTAKFLHKHEKEPRLPPRELGCGSCVHGGRGGCVHGAVAAGTTA